LLSSLSKIRADLARASPTSLENGQSSRISVLKQVEAELFFVNAVERLEQTSWPLLSLLFTVKIQSSFKIHNRNHFRWYLHNGYINPLWLLSMHIATQKEKTKKFSLTSVERSTALIVGTIRIYKNMGCWVQKTSVVNPEKNMSWAQRSGILLLALLQNSLMGGIVYGWSSIDSTLLIASESQGGAGVDPRETSQVFSWAASAAMVSSFFLGIVLDFFGPRLCSLVSLSTIAIGCWLLSQSHDLVQLSVGFCVLAFGGPGICASIIHIANLFPKSKNLVMSSLSGFITVSFSVLSLFDFMWNRYQWATFHCLFGYYSLLAWVLAVSAFFIYPDTPYEDTSDDEDLSIEGSDEEEKVNGLETEDSRLLVTKREPPVHRSPTTVVLKNVASLSVIPEHRHHHESHIQSVAAGPSLVHQQPLNSYLCPYTRTDSYMVSREVMVNDDPDKDVIISVKDQPFLKQLFSGGYVRSCLYFWVCSFVANFYVSSLTTELADLDFYADSVQHDLTRTFTLFMASGVLGSILVRPLHYLSLRLATGTIIMTNHPCPVRMYNCQVGVLIDKLGVEICTIMSLVFAQLQLAIVVLWKEYQPMMALSFFLYTLFRAFLYPVFIASLTSRLGFKYFGLLLGIGFAVSGLFQLLMAPLSNLVAGDCHLKASTVSLGENSCAKGLWISLHLLELSAMLGLMVVPYLDYRAKQAREAVVAEYKARHGL
jgi:MFS family permease